MNAFVWLAFGVAVFGCVISHPMDDALAEASVHTDLPAEDVGCGFFGCGSKTVIHNHNAGYGNYHNAGYGHTSAYGSRYGTGYGHRGHVHNHIHVKGPVYGYGAFRSTDHVGAPPAVQKSQHHQGFIMPGLHHHQNAKHDDHPASAAPQLRHGYPAPSPHEYPAPAHHGYPSPGPMPHPAPAHHDYPAPAHHDYSAPAHHDYPHPAPAVNCGKNILVGCQPSVQEVPCQPSSHGSGPTY